MCRIHSNLTEYAKFEEGTHIHTVTAFGFIFCFLWSLISTQPSPARQKKYPNSLFIPVLALGEQIRVEKSLRIILGHP